MYTSETIKVSYNGDSIAHKCDFEKVSRVTGTKIVPKKAYASVKDDKSLFPDKNFRDVVSNQLNKEHFDILMVHAPSVDITNLKKLQRQNNWYLEQKASNSSYELVKTVEHAVKNHPNIKTAVIIERAPRQDDMERLSQVANKELHRFVNFSQYKDKIKVVSHSLKTVGEQPHLVYGSPDTHYNYDGFHFRGILGKQVFTESIINVFN